MRNLVTCDPCHAVMAYTHLKKTDKIVDRVVSNDASNMQEIGGTTIVLYLRNNGFDLRRLRSTPIVVPSKCIRRKGDGETERGE